MRAELVIVSASDEGWVGLDQLVTMCRSRGHVEVLAYDSRRYVGALIGIHNPKGEKVGRVTRTRNVEYLVVAGQRDRVIEVCRRHGEEAARPSPTFSRAGS